jgi:hypothetical protein
LFGTHDSKYGGSGTPRSTQEVLSKLDKALTAIFNEDGKKTVIYYLTNRFELSLEQATKDPSRLESSLTSMLGEVGWMVVKKAILEEFWDKKIGVDETMVVQRASLLETFSFVRNLGVGSFLGV